MHILKIATAALILTGGLAGPATPQPSTPVTLYRNAMVWNGVGFSRRTLAVRGGRFVAVSRSEAGAITVDLAGRYVVPAYANAHCHLTSANRASSDTFLNAGVFYVWNPNSITLPLRDLRFFGQPDTVDVAIAQGGITEPRGHPEPLYVDILSKYVYRGRDAAWFRGNAFHYGRTPTEIDTALDALVAQHADFVKAYLIRSQEYVRRRDDPAFESQRGLNPANLPYLVAGAHRRGRKVAVHVETAQDLLTAARAEADVAAHLPGYNRIQPDGAGTLTPSIAHAVARSGMRLTPTYSVGAAEIAEAAAKGTPLAGAERTLAEQRHNLRLLKRAGARLWMGTDGPGPVFDEAEHWVRLRAFSAAEAARIVLSTGRELFPNRRVGCLDRGCEADFLVLRGDPTRDITQLRAIERRIKAGRTLPDAAPPA